MSLKKDKIGKRFIVLSLSAVPALAHLCTILLSQETSVNVIPFLGMMFSPKFGLVFLLVILPDLSSSVTHFLRYIFPDPRRLNPILPVAREHFPMFYAFPEL